jgi:dynein heavy chain, axonemal
LSKGADPYNSLIELKSEMSYFLKTFYSLSLGQGQGEKAQNLIINGRKNGDWVLLENCHLAVSWLETLGKLFENQDPKEINPYFRLWLTSMPTAQFPVKLLQSSIKITNEPPKGLRETALGLYSELDKNKYTAYSIQSKRMIYQLVMYHCIITERRKYGSIGWNISYDWVNSDFAISSY